MADSEKPETGDSAEKAYAAAAEAVEVKAASDAPVEFPPKAKRARKPRAADSAAAVTAPAVIVAEPAPEPTPAPAVAAKAPAPRKPKPKAPMVKAKPLVKPALPAPCKFTPITKPQISNQTAAPITKPEISQLKEKTMNAQTNDFTTDKFAGIKEVFTDVKTKAKAAFDKGTSSIGDATEFAKGNVEAFVESGKIYAAGLQEIGSTYVAESKTAFETLTADAKDLAAQKTPTEFFKLQGELAKKNFDSAVAFGTKSSEAWLKLAGDAFAPISGRVSLAVDKIKTAA